MLLLRSLLFNLFLYTLNINLYTMPLHHQALDLQLNSYLNHYHKWNYSLSPGGKIVYIAENNLDNNLAMLVLAHVFFH